MKPMAKEWLEKAEGDYAIMERESRVRKNPGFDGICFHAQQCAEKYLKARLCESGVHFGKIHDLVSLLEQVLPIEPFWEAARQDLAYLSDFAVRYRYPGESADRIAAMAARDLCRRFRKMARNSMGLK